MSCYNRNWERPVWVCLDLYDSSQVPQVANTGTGRGCSRRGSGQLTLKGGSRVSTGGIGWQGVPFRYARVTLHTTEPTCTQPSIVKHTTGHLCPVVCRHFREHGRRGQRYKRLFWKHLFGLQPISDLKVQFAVCDYLHNVSHMIWLITNRNRKDCLAYVNNVCLRMLGCVICARLCVSARLCAFLLGCVLCLARFVLVIDGRTVFHDVYHSNYLYQYD